MRNTKSPMRRLIGNFALTVTTSFEAPGTPQHNVDGKLYAAPEKFGRKHRRL